MFLDWLGCSCSLLSWMGRIYKEGWSSEDRIWNIESEGSEMVLEKNRPRADKSLFQVPEGPTVWRRHRQVTCPRTGAGQISAQRRCRPTENLWAVWSLCLCVGGEWTSVRKALERMHLERDWTRWALSSDGPSCFFEVHSGSHMNWVREAVVIWFLFWVRVRQAWVQRSDRLGLNLRLTDSQPTALSTSLGFA